MATTPQLITRVDFVPFSTRDIDAACAFYGETLGLPRSVYVPERSYAEFETQGAGRGRRRAPRREESRSGSWMRGWPGGCGPCAAVGGVEFDRSRGGDVLRARRLAPGGP